MSVRRSVAVVLLVSGVTAVAFALLPLVFAKNGSNPEVTPAPTDVRTDGQSASDAMTVFITYIRVSDEVAQDHFRGWEARILPLTSGEVQEWHKNYDPQAEAEDYYQVGERVVESIRLKPDGYRVDGDGFGRADLGVCVDSSGLQMVAPGSLDDILPPGRYSVSVTMVLWPDGWTVDRYSVDDSQTSESDDSSCVAEEGQR